MSYFAAGILSHLACHGDTGRVFCELMERLGAKVHIKKEKQTKYVLHVKFAEFIFLCISSGIPGNSELATSPE